MYWKHSNPNCSGSRRDKVALRIACNKNIKFKIIKIRTSCQYVGYFTTAKTLSGPRVGRSWYSGITPLQFERTCSKRFSLHFTNILRRYIAAPKFTDAWRFRFHGTKSHLYMDARCPVPRKFGKCCMACDEIQRKFVCQTKTDVKRVFLFWKQRNGRNQLFARSCWRSPLCEPGSQCAV